MKNWGTLRGELDELVAGHGEVVRGEIRQLVALVNLAESYRLDEAELVEALLEVRVPGGGEGTPNISEFLALEVGAALGIPASEAAGRIHNALDLKYRHPHLWAAVLDGEFRVWQAARITRRVENSRLNLEQVASVDAAFVRQARGLPFGRAMRLLEALILEADPALAEQHAREARQARGVWFKQSQYGTTQMGASLGAKDALFLRASTRQLAEILARQGDTDTADQREAKALGLLANPARALQLLQASPEVNALVAPRELDSAVDVAGFASTTLDPEKLLPRAELVVHLSAQTLTEGHGVARAEDVGALDVSALREFLGNTRVTVRPVVDLNEVPPVDRYEIPDSIRRVVGSREVFESFPYSNIQAKHCDLDHIRPWYLTNGPGQTSAENLTHLSRRVHRAKTAGHWMLYQKDPTSYAWESPLGYHYRMGGQGTQRQAKQSIA